MTIPHPPPHPTPHPTSRQGPRPLPLHLTAAAMVSTSSSAAWTLLKSGWMPWSDDLAKVRSAVQKDLANADPEAFATALFAELTHRHDRFLSGVETYRSHPYRRQQPTPPPLWERGPAQLLDYGTASPAGKTGRPILVVPSLINRSYIMDLTENHSFLRFLAAGGFRPLLVDWGTPGSAELERTLDDYIAGDLASALDTAVEVAGGDPVPVIGYCMGGTLAAALSVLQPEKVASLLLLATPWDFHAGTDGPPPAVTSGRRALEQVISAAGCLPVDALQTMFFSLDPMQGWNKFRAFAELNPASAAAISFVALEDWLNDGVPLSAPVARECLFGWYGDNSPARGEWVVAGQRINPAEIACPALGVLPAQDRIVPPRSAAALVNTIPDADTLTPKAGHIGMMVGRKAESALWHPLSEWLKNH